MNPPQVHACASSSLCFTHPTSILIQDNSHEKMNTVLLVKSIKVFLCEVLSWFCIYKIFSTMRQINVHLLILLKVKMKGKSLSHVRLFATPWTIQSMEFSRPEYWSGSPFPSPKDLPNPGIEPRSPTLEADSLPAEYNSFSAPYFYVTL